MKSHKAKKQISPFTIILFIVLAIHCFTILYLLYWALITSVKHQMDFRLNLYKLPKGLPWEWNWENYYAVFMKFYVPVKRDGVLLKIGMEYQLLYTLVYCFSSAIVTTMVPCLVSYCVAKFKYKFSAILEGVVLVTMVLPIVGNSASTMQFLQAFQLYDNIWLLNIVTQFSFGGMYFLIFKASFEALTNDYRDAAYLDGANDFSVLFRIMLPLVSKIIFTVFLLQFIAAWEDYQRPLLYLPNYPTIAYGVYYFTHTSQQELNTVPAKLASAVMMAIPIVTLYIIFKEKLMGNLSMGGLKE